MGSNNVYKIKKEHERFFAICFVCRENYGLKTQYTLSQLGGHMSGHAKKGEYRV